MIASCFSEDAILDMESTKLEGSAAIKRYYGGRLGKLKDAPTGHIPQTNRISTPLMANIEIELEGDTAHRDSTCLASYAVDREGKGIVIVRGTRNSDEFVYTDAGWRIRQRGTAVNGFPNPLDD